MTMFFLNKDITPPNTGEPQTFSLLWIYYLYAKQLAVIVGFPKSKMDNQLFP